MLPTIFTTGYLMILNCLLRTHNGGPLGRLQQFPVAHDVLLLESPDDLVGNFFKVVGSERQDGGTSSREADAQQTRLRVRRHGLDDIGEARDQGLPVGLVELVLHRQIDELGVRRRVP